MKSKLILTFFTCFFLLGVFIFKDYGFSWDESVSRKNGLMVYQYVTGQNDWLLNYSERSFGTAFELPLYALERLFHLKSTQHIYYLRHFLTFLFFFISTVFFYLIIKKRFNSYLGLLGVLFLILSPRIFADSFYNSKDIGFLSATIIATYTLVLFLNNPTGKRAVFHGIACAFAVGIRLPGLLFIALSIGFILFEAILTYPNQRKKWLGWMLIFIVSCTTFTVIFWPYLWSNPVGYFSETVSNTARSMSSYRAGVTNLLYLGNYIPVSAIPWHYVPVWILITTPLSFIPLFLIGTIATFWRCIKNPSQFYLKRREDLIFLTSFFAPILTVMMLDSVFFNGWRHLYFIYPSFILIVLIGIEAVWFFLKNRLKDRVRFIGQAGFVGLISLDLVLVSFFMIRYHPYQNLYFNILAGGMENVKRNFELDYWGLTFREGLEYIATQDPSLAKTVGFIYGHRDNMDILPSEIRKRFAFRPEEEAEYLLVNHFWYDKKLTWGLKEIYNVTIDGVAVMTVYKRHEK